MTPEEKYKGFVLQKLDAIEKVLETFLFIEVPQRLSTNKKIEILAVADEVYQRPFVIYLQRENHSYATPTQLPEEIKALATPEELQEYWDNKLETAELDVTIIHSWLEKFLSTRKAELSKIYSQIILSTPDERGEDILTGTKDVEL